MRRALAVAPLLLALACSGVDAGTDTGAKARTGCVRLAIPAYVGADDFERAGTEADPAVLVLNPANGPDVERDDDLVAAVEDVRARGVEVLGYIATGYGTATADEVLEQSERYRRWYAVDGIFLDEVSSDPGALARYADIASVLRDAEVETLVLNPGVYPDPGYADLADVVVTFEGPVSEYRDDLARPDGFDPAREWHLVHTASAADARAAVDLAAERGVRRVFVTDRPEAGDTWNALPPYLDDEVTWARRARCRPGP